MLIRECVAKIDIDAALAIIDGTGPLSTDGTWGNHMHFTSAAVGDWEKSTVPSAVKEMP